MFQYSNGWLDELLFGMSVYPRDFSKQLRSQLAKGITLDAALRELRSDGASIIECIKSTKSALGCDPAEAKRLIHDSTAWADVVKRTDAMWAEFAEELDKNVEPSASPKKSGSATSPGNLEAMKGPPSGS
jgi:hypothetical protein